MSGTSAARPACCRSAERIGGRAVGVSYMTGMGALLTTRLTRALTRGWFHIMEDWMLVLSSVHHELACQDGDEGVDQGNAAVRDGS